MSTLFPFGWLAALGFVNSCPVCNKITKREQGFICFACSLDAPYTDMWLMRDNPLEQRFWGMVPIERAASLLWYKSQGQWQKVIHQFKYHSKHFLGEKFGYLMAAEFSKGGFFDGVDLIVPIPLHPLRRLQRQYNQSELLAHGISRYTGIPTNFKAVRRTANNPPQAQLHYNDRWRHTENIFDIPNPKALTGRHIVIVDDVFTSGSTLTSCAKAIYKACNGDVKISVATLAAAQYMLQEE